MKQRLLSFKIKPQWRKTSLLLLSFALVTFSFGQVNVTKLAGGGEKPYPFDIPADENWNAGSPYSLVVMDNGDIYFGDYHGEKWGISKIDGASGMISQVLVDGEESTGDGGPVQKATVKGGIYGMTLDGDGNIYFSDAASGVVRKIDMTTGYVTLVAGNYEKGDIDEGAYATSTSLHTPAGIEFNGDYSKMWVTDMGNNKIYEVDMATKMINTVAGTGEASEAGDGILAANSGFDGPSDLLYHSADGNEYVFVITFGGTLSKINLATGVITRVAGTGDDCVEGDGGLALEACFKKGVGLTMAPDGENIYFGDIEGYGIRRVNLTTGLIFTFVGAPDASDNPLHGGGPADEASVKNAAFSDMDASGDLFFAEMGMPGFIRKVDMTTNTITTLAGNGTEPTEALSGIFAKDVTNLNAATVVENGGVVYIGDNNNHILRKIDLNGVISTIAGVAGESAFKGEGLADTMNFGGFEDMVWSDARNTMYIADAGHDVIYGLDMNDMSMSVVVGTGEAGYTASGGMGDTTMISDPHGLGLYVDTLFFVERGNHIVRKVDLTSGMVHDVAGIQGEAGNEIMLPAAESKFENLTGVAVDPATGDIFIAQDANNVVVRWDAEKDTVFAFADEFTKPNGLFIDANGSLIVADAESGLKVYDISSGTWDMTLSGVGNTYNAFASAVGYFTASQMDGVYHAIVQTDAITIISDFAASNDASGLIPGLMKTAGAERVLDGYIDHYRDSVEARDAVADLVALQTLVDNANQDTIFKVIQSLADADDASVLEIFHLDYSGITNIVPENLDAYRTAVANTTSATLTDIAALQTLVDDTNTDQENTVISAIDAMAAANDAANLTVDMLIQAGVEGAVEDDTKYLDAYKAAVEAETGVADLTALQTIVDNTNATLALENIQMMADIDDASTLTINTLVDAGVTGTVEGNLMYYKMAVEDSTAATLPDLAAVQQLVDDINTWVTDAENALTTIDGYAQASDATALTPEQLETAWAENVMPSYLGAYKTEIENQDAIENLDTLQYVVDIVNSAQMAAEQAAALTAIQGYADGDDASAMTADELSTAGAEEVDAAYLPEYKVAVAADSSANLANADSIQKFIVDPVNMMMVQEAVDSIAGMAKDDDATDLSHALLFQAELTDHGSNRILDSLRSKLETVDIDSTAASTKEKIQGLLNDINAEITDADVFVMIQDMATTNDASSLEFTMFEELDLSFNYYNYTVYQDSIVARDVIVDVPDLQMLIDSADVAEEALAQVNALDAINDMAVASDASTLTRNMLETALDSDALLRKTQRHFELYQDSIAGQTGIAGVTELENVIKNANRQKGIEVIQSYATANDAADMSEGELVVAGVEESSILSYNLPVYKDSVAGADAVELETTPMIQTLITTINTNENTIALDMILAMSDGGDTSALSVPMLQKAEVDFRDGDYLQAYKTAIHDAGALANLQELQAVVDVVNAWEYIKEMPGSNAANDLTFDMMTTAGVDGTILQPEFLQDYRMAVFNAAEITSIEGLETLLEETNVQSTLELILNMAGGDASELTINMLEYVGVPSEDLYPDYLDTYKSEIERKPNIPDLDRLIIAIQDANQIAAFADVQGMAGGDASSLTIDLLGLAGVPQDDLVADNLTAYQDSIQNVSEITSQAMLTEIIRGVNEEVNEMNAFAEVQAMAGGDASSLTIDLLGRAGVPQDDLIDDNLTAYQDSIENVSAMSDQAALIALIQGVNENITNISPLTLNNNIVLYPNPSQGMIEFNFGKLYNHTFDVKVTDMTGKVVLMKEIGVVNNFIDLTPYSNGVYFLQITLENTTVTKRIILE